MVAITNSRSKEYKVSSPLTLHRWQLIYDKMRLHYRWRGCWIEEDHGLSLVEGWFQTKSQIIINLRCYFQNVTQLKVNRLLLILEHDVAWQTFPDCFINVFHEIYVRKADKPAILSTSKASKFYQRNLIWVIVDNYTRWKNQTCKKPFLASCLKENGFNTSRMKQWLDVRENDIRCIVK